MSSRVIGWALFLVAFGIAILATERATMWEDRAMSTCWLGIEVPIPGPRPLIAYPNAQNFEWCGGDPAADSTPIIITGGDAPPSRS